MKSNLKLYAWLFVNWLNTCWRLSRISLWHLLPSIIVGPCSLFACLSFISFNPCTQSMHACIRPTYHLLHHWNTSFPPTIAQINNSLHLPIHLCQTTNSIKQKLTIYAANWSNYIFCFWLNKGHWYWHHYIKSPPKTLIGILIKQQGWSKGGGCI